MLLFTANFDWLFLRHSWGGVFLRDATTHADVSWHPEGAAVVEGAASGSEEAPSQSSQPCGSGERWSASSTCEGEAFLNFKFWIFESIVATVLFKIKKASLYFYLLWELQFISSTYTLPTWNSVVETIWFHFSKWNFSRWFTIKTFVFCMHAVIFESWKSFCRFVYCETTREAFEGRKFTEWKVPTIGMANSAFFQFLFDGDEFRVHKAPMPFFYIEISIQFAARFYPFCKLAENIRTKVEWPFTGSQNPKTVLIFQMMGKQNEARSGSANTGTVLTVSWWNSSFYSEVVKRISWKVLVLDVDCSCEPKEDASPYFLLHFKDVALNGKERKNSWNLIINFIERKRKTYCNLSFFIPFDSTKDWKTNYLLNLNAFNDEMWKI